MDIFISYSSQDAGLAEQLTHRLRGEGHTVFFDRESLLPGEAYDRHIREAVQGCDRFVFLLSADSIGPGSYALSELAMARERWPVPAGHVLPVAVGPVDYDALPPYLGALTVFRPSGDAVADVVALLGAQERRRRLRVACGAGAALAALALIGGAAWWWFAPVPSTLARTSGSSAASSSVTSAAASPAAPAASQAATAPIAEPVRLVGMLTNSGWMIHLDVVGPARPREIFVRWEGEPGFGSTGLQSTRDSQTGLPLPRMDIELEVDPKAPLAKRRIDVRYDDAVGRSHGPYALIFDPKAQVVAETRQLLEATRASWLSFREYPAGHRLVYFTHLVSNRNGLSEIRYSVDTDALDQRFEITPDWGGPGAPRIRESDPLMIEIPMAARYVRVQLVYADGGVAPARRFDVRPG
ncbi:MAG: toll/interleukin-1 receptor domain-containing protein [Burkholderiaceae bacterium]